MFKPIVYLTDDSYWNFGWNWREAQFIESRVSTLLPRSLSTRFISLQAAPRRRFFQHLDHQVERTKSNLRNPFFPPVKYHTIVIRSATSYELVCWRTKWVILIFIYLIFPASDESCRTVLPHGFPVCTGIDQPGWHSGEGVFFNQKKKNKQTKQNEISFTFPPSVEWIMFLPSPVCVQRE